MVLYKKLLILLILILAIYVLMRLFTRRRVLLAKQGTSQMSGAGVAEATPTVEKFTGADEKTAQNLPLTNYFVKSSYNSCFDSNAIVSPFSAKVLGGVLRKGYRFIDLEVCKISGLTDPIRVCINSSYGDETQQDGSVTFPLVDAIKEIINTGLTMTETGAKNYYEPLFIHIRVKHGTLSQTPDINTFYKSINSILFSTTAGSSTDLGNFVYPISAASGGGANNCQKMANLTLSKIMNSNKKCFIIIDKTNLNTDAISDAFNDNVIMSGFNTGDVALYKYDDVRAKDGLYVLNDKDGKYAAEKKVTASGDTVNATTFSIAISGSKYESSNPYPYDIAKKYGIQFATMNFSVNDEGLKKYEAIFNGGGSGSAASKKKITGFVPMAQVIRQAATDVRSDMKGDIKRGIYIGLGIMGATALIYGIYRYGGLANFLRGAPQSGGGRRKGAIA